jgi:glycosyltransferase involved in cell wall biosynthesis
LYKSLISATEAYLNHFRQTWSKVAAFIAPSEFLRDVVVSSGLPSDRVHVLPNPVDAAESPKRLPDSQPFFVYTGRLTHGKGLDVLLQASRLMKRRARILLYGTGPLEGAIIDEVKRDRLPVEVRGYATKPVLAAAFHRCVAALVPSVWYENCPMAILEAAGRGVATVASDLGAMKELISHGESGLLFGPGDARALSSALDELVDRPAWALDLGQKAWRNVRERHDPGVHYQGLMTIYEEALDLCRTSTAIRPVSL